MPQTSKEHFHISARNVKQMPVDMAMDNIPEVMERLGFGFRRGADTVRDMAQAYGMDAIQTPVTTPTIPNLVQFLQNWLPGQVHVMTAAREIDTLIGISTQGAWEDEQIVQEVLENTAYAKPYGDYTNTPLADWNLNFVPRTNIRFEMGMRVGMLEEARAGRVRVNSGEAKRQSCGISLEIVRNLVGFSGYSSGNNNTYGFLNDPGLSAYVTVAQNGGSTSTLWANKTFLEICKDIRTAIVALRNQAKGNYDPMSMDTTLALPLNAIDYLTVTSDFGISVWDWLRQTYPKIRVVNAVQLNNADGVGSGHGAFYLYAEKVSDLSTDDGRVWTQVVPTKFMVLGVTKLAKGYEEDYSNATAGAMCKRPFLVVRYVGIS